MPRPRIPVRIQPYFGYRSATRLTLSARALRSRAPLFSPGSIWRALRTIMKLFASREVAGVEVTLRYEASGKLHESTAATDEERYVRFDLDLADWSLAEQTAWDIVSLHWHEGDVSASVEGFVLAPAQNATLGIISDIDDTIIQTGVTGSAGSVLRNWKRLLATMPEDRQQVPGADQLYGALGGGLARSVAARAAAENRGEALPTVSGRPFFYVSSSPWNLYSYLVAFKRRHGLPLGPVALRDWGLNRATFGSSSHGAHKRNAIDAILSIYPDMRFVLVGDDTQGDLIAFAEVVADHPGRVAAVFIRRAGEPANEAEMKAQHVIEAVGIPFWMGDDYATTQAFLTQTGLVEDEAAETLVAAVADGVSPAP
ncbi:MAG: App1 family protein [Parerythrobacter sp.]